MNRRSSGNYLRPKAWIAEKLAVSEDAIDGMILAGQIPAPIATRNTDGQALFDGLAVHEVVQRIRREQREREAAAAAALEWVH